MKAKRHAKILELIASYEIDTQEGLLKSLRENGFDVTQATVSRDIKELRLVKELSHAGQYRYVVSEKRENKTLRDKYLSILSDSVLATDYAGNTVVVRCPTGMAQAACAAIDGMEWDSVVGTIAGDDTIFILMRTEPAAADFAKRLHESLGK